MTSVWDFPLMTSLLCTKPQEHKTPSPRPGNYQWMTTQSYANNTYCCLIFSQPSHTASLTCTNFWKSSCPLWLQKLMYYSYSSHSNTLWSLNKYKWEWFYSSQTNKLTCHSSAHLRHKNHSQKLISFSPKTIITLAVAWTVNAYISGSNNTHTHKKKQLLAT